MAVAADAAAMAGAADAAMVAAMAVWVAAVMVAVHSMEAADAEDSMSIVFCTMDPILVQMDRGFRPPRAPGSPQPERRIIFTARCRIQDRRRR